MSLPPDEHPPGLVLDARLHLLDRQVLDVDGVPVCTVDDLEVHGVDGSDLPDGTQTAVVTSLLSGAVLATRVFGGRPPSSRWHRIRWTHVADVGTTVRARRARRHARRDLDRAVGPRPRDRPAAGRSP